MEQPAQENRLWSKRVPYLLVGAILCAAGLFLVPLEWFLLESLLPKRLVYPFGPDNPGAWQTPPLTFYGSLAAIRIAMAMAAYWLGERRMAGISSTFGRVLLASFLVELAVLAAMWALSIILVARAGGH